VLNILIDEELIVNRTDPLLAIVYNVASPSLALDVDDDSACKIWIVIKLEADF